MPGYVHHVQWSVGDLSACLQTLTKEFGWSVLAMRRGEAVVRAGKTVFLISEKEESRGDPDEGTAYPRIQCCQGRECSHGDSVFNVSLEVDNVKNTCRVMKDKGSIVIMPPQTIHSPKGSVHFALVTSPCDNVLHSLVNTQQFGGQFLPGFLDQTRSTEQSVGLTFMDHITYVCREGESKTILDWYNETCGMVRFMMNKEEVDEEGTVIDGEVGIRLKVGEWLSEWLCKEEGSQTGEEQKERNFKLVLAEPLTGTNKGHVNSFLSLHPGPGVQHIGLCTDNMAWSVSSLARRGVQFRVPPPAYYTLKNKEQQFVAAGLQFIECQQLGILIDQESGETGNEPSHLLQIFTKPVFEVDTFFLEIIQRKGARGFGAGNIRALALSIIEMQKRQLEESENKEQ